MTFPRTATRPWAWGLAALCACAAHAQDLSYDAKGTALIFQNQVNVAASVPATYFGMIANQWGYGGIQMNQDTRSRSTIFSIWDQTLPGGQIEETTEAAYNATLPILKHGRFGGEGTGAQFLFTSNWVYGSDYRVAYRAFPEADGAHVRFSGFYFDPALGVWVYAVTYRANTGGVPLAMADFYAFCENYGDTWGTRTATYSNAWAYVPGTGWRDLTSGWAFNLPPDDQPTQTNRPDYGQILTGPGGFTINATTDPATHTQAEWAPVAYTPLASEAPIPIPYYLGCGSTGAQGNWEPDGYFQDLAGDSAAQTFTATVATRGVGNPAPQAVYQNARTGSAFQYNLIGFLPGQEIQLRLHFVETVCSRAGLRLHDVTVNGHKVLENFDIFHEAGGPDRAVVRDFQAQADANGQIVVGFATAKGSRLPSASVSAISAAPGRPAFKLDPAAVTVMRGFGATGQETVLSLNGFSEPVRLQLLDPPHGVTATLSPEPVGFGTGANTSAATLTLAASAWAPLTTRWSALLLASSRDEDRLVPVAITVQDPVPVFVQANESVFSNGAASVQAVFTAPQVQGDLNVVAVQWQDATANVTSVTDTSGNTYVLAAGPVRNPDQPGSQALYYASGIHAAAADTVTVTFDSVAAYPDLLIADYAGVRTLVATASATSAPSGDTTTTLDSGPVTVGANVLLFGASNVENWTDAPGAGFTQRFQSDWGNVIEDQITGAAGTYDATAGQYASGPAPWIMQLAAFQ